MTPTSNHRLLRLVRRSTPASSFYSSSSLSSFSFVSSSSSVRSFRSLSCCSSSSSSSSSSAAITSTQTYSLSSFFSTTSTSASSPHPPLHRTWNKDLKVYPLAPTLRTVPTSIPYPPYAKVPWNPRIGIPMVGDKNRIELKGRKEIDQMRRACEIASYIREFAGKLVQPGVTTDDIDRLAHEEIVKLNAYPSPLGYRGFKRSIATSVNQVVCHGIPDNRPLEDGDIINIDVSTYFNQYHGDCSGMFLCGKVDEAGKRLVETTIQATRDAINMCGPGVYISRIGDVISSHAEAHGYGIVEEYCGHGIGKDFHLPPFILHYRNSYPGTMHAGMVFTIEPMLNEGDSGCHVLQDEWTVVTNDNSRSAQYEETILITDDGAEILTKH